MVKQKRGKTKKSRRAVNRRIRVAGLALTLVMAVLFGLGVRSFFVVPPQAKKEAEEIERMLREQQEAEEEQRRIRQEELARKAAEEAERKRIEEELAANPLKAMYTDASEMSVVGIGDSVMLGAVNALYEKFPNGYFDAVFGRTIYDGKKVTAWMAEQGTLGDVVVFSLGTNSYIEEADVEELIQYCGDRPTFWITTVGVSNDSNEKTRDVLSRYEKAYIVDWESEATEHLSAYILADGLHPTPEGAAAYAQLIHDTINECVLGR